MNTQKIKSLFCKNNKNYLLFGLCILGILLLSFSGGFKKDKAIAQNSIKQNDEDYCKTIEDKIKELVTAITGNKTCIVAVTLENGSEYIYANQNTVDTNQTEDKANDNVATKESHKKSQEYIIIEGSNGEESALIVTEKKPGVRGVAIVAAGVNNMNYDIISSSVSAMLGIPDRKISIASTG